MILKRKFAAKPARQDEPKTSELRETISTVLWALAIAFVLRTFLFQPFHIPSGSMLPGLMKGDYVITSKYSVGYGKFAAAPLPFPVKKGRLMERGPDRGDVIVFRPEGSKKNYIKRLIGLPGDQVQMVDGVLHINGTAVKLEAGEAQTVTIQGNPVTGQIQNETIGSDETHIVFNTQDNNDLDNTTVQTVPAGHFYMMGDNRDHSLDSRVSVPFGGAGYVPRENIIGKAEIILLSVNEEFSIKMPWTWLNFRKNRWFKSVK